MVLAELDRCKTTAFYYMKDASSATPSLPVGSDESGSVRVGFSSTKRETVMLPHFSGEEKTTYLSYPVWKKQWDLHIQEMGVFW